MTIIEFLQEYERNCEGMLEATEQSVYFSLILIWNRLRRPEWFRVSQTELMRKSGIKGHNRLERAQNGLEEKRFIKTEKKARTATRLYKLEPLPITSETDVATLKIDVDDTSETDVEKPSTLKTDLVYAQNERNLRPKQLISQRQSNTEFSTVVEIGNSNLDTIPKEVLKTFQEEIRLVPSPVEIDKMQVLVEEHKPEPVIKAMQRAAMRNKRSLGYVEAILKSWKENGYDEPEGGSNIERFKRNARRPEKEDPDKWHKAAERQRKFEERMRAQYGEGWNLPEVPCGDV